MDDRQNGYRGDEGAAMPSKGLTVENLDRTSPLDSTAENQPSEQTAKRRETLALYLEQLEEARHSGTDLQEALAGIDLDAWELAQLNHGLGDASNRWQALIVEGVAFRNKYETDLGWAPSGQQLSAEEHADFRAILTTDAALGVALLEETQRAVNQLILSGELDEAKKLTGFRNKIGKSINELRDHLGAAGFAEATSISEELVTPEEQASWTGRERPKFVPAKTTSRGAMKQWGSSSRPTDQVVFKSEVLHSHLKPLLMLLGLSVVVWGVFILPKLTFESVLTLTLNDISPRSEIRHVVAKPPSLFVELDSREWHTLSKQEQLDLVDDVGRTAAAAGYNGAHFKLENGKPAAQWLKERGGRLID